MKALSKLKSIEGKIANKAKNIKTPSMWGEFKDFLKEYKVIGLAIAFIMGVAPLL